MRETKKLHLISLGCVKNLVDSEVMLGKLKEYEISDNIHESDVIIINTCGFIEAAKKESIQTIFNALRDKKEHAILVVSGCLSERYKNELQKEIPEIDIITGVSDYDRIDEMLEKRKGISTEKVFLSNENNDRVISASCVHAYVKISEGCNQQCSFCAIPQFKGTLQSRSVESIMKEIKILVKKGFKDISFVAQDSSSYLKDHGQNNGLIQLIDALEYSGLSSARILYLYPSSTTPNIIESIAQSHIMQNYFDMPIQHIADSMLKRMRRGANQKKHKELLTLMRNIEGSFLRTSLIVGHPEESDEEFEELIDFLQSFYFDRINVFAYSDEEGTHSYHNPHKIDPKTIKKRMKILAQIIDKQHEHSLKRMLHQEIPILIDAHQGEYDYLYKARDLRWAPEIDGDILINENLLHKKFSAGLYRAKITQKVKKDLIATLLEEY